MGGNVERHIGDDDRDGAAIEALQPGGNGMTHAARDVLAERQRQIERMTKELDEARAQVAAALAHPPQPSVSVSCPAPAPDDETYYSKGKDANWLAALSDEDLAEAVCFAAQDLNDTGLGDDLDKWMPFQAMMCIAADRIKKLITAQPSVSDASAALASGGRA